MNLETEFCRTNDFAFLAVPAALSLASFHASMVLSRWTWITDGIVMAMVERLSMFGSNQADLGRRAKGSTNLLRAAC